MLYIDRMHLRYQTNIGVIIMIVWILKVCGCSVCTIPGTFFYGCWIGSYLVSSISHWQFQRFSFMVPNIRFQNMKVKILLLFKSWHIRVTLPTAASLRRYELALCGSEHGASGPLIHGHQGPSKGLSGPRWRGAEVGVCHQGGVGLWASCIISGSPNLGSCWARCLGGLGG